MHADYSRQLNDPQALAHFFVEHEASPAADLKTYMLGFCRAPRTSMAASLSRMTVAVRTRWRGCSTSTPAARVGG